MEYGQQMQQAKDNALVGLYQNPGYHFERREKKTVILDVSSLTSSVAIEEEFNVKLLEPLRVDRLSDVYLDSFITFNAKKNDTLATMGFTLNINEFNINSNVASNQDKGSGYDSKKFNRIFIANNETTANGGDGSVSHKSKKFNYIASINPCTISSLSGEILDSGSRRTGLSPEYGNPFNNDSRFIAEFMIVARD
jgi:hypothetical protein